MDIGIGGVGLAVILTIVLGTVYRVVPSIGDRWKPLIAIAVGVVLGLVALGYNGLPWTFVNIIDYIAFGFLAGASAVGLYEGKRALTKPRA